MRYLITGGCGFIGSHFVSKILSTGGAEALVVDKLTYAAHPYTREVLLQEYGSLAFVLLKHDIAADNTVETLLRYDFDAIVHFAAESHVDRSLLSSREFVLTNVVGFQNIAELARKKGVRLLHVSTDEVYGSLGPTDVPFTEDSSLNPTSPYAASKAGADLLALAAIRSHNQDIIIARCTNNYGPFQFPEKLIPVLITRALESKPLPLYGDGQQIRDWIFVTDHCEALVALIREGRCGEIYNISAQQPRTNLDVAYCVLDILKKPHSLIQLVGDRPGHDRRYGLTTTKIESAVGWKPRLTFEEGLLKTIDWYQNHVSWWQSARDSDNYQSYFRNNYETKLLPELESREVRVDNA